MFELIPADTHIDFIGRRKICGLVSAALLLAGVLAIPVQGVKLGIDFAGGTEMQVKFHEGADADEGSIREVASGCGVPDPSVERYGESDADEYLIRFKVATVGEPDLVTCPLSPEQQAELAAAAEAGVGMDVEGEIVDRIGLAMGNTLGGLDIQRVEFVGPRVGAELRRDGITAIGVACLMILLYISFRFSIRFAPGAFRSYCDLKRPAGRATSPGRPVPRSAGSLAAVVAERPRLSPSLHGSATSCGPQAIPRRAFMKLPTVSPLGRRPARSRNRPREPPWLVPIDTWPCRKVLLWRSIRGGCTSPKAWPASFLPGRTLGGNGRPRVSGSWAMESYGPT